MIGFTLNGQPVTTQAAPTARLTEVLRDHLGRVGTKVGCDAGDCGACTVLLNGAQVCACMVPAARLSGADVETIESDAEDLDQLRDAFLRHGAAQCGICTPGMLMAAVDLRRRIAAPTELQVQDALGGVLCRCTGYRKIIAAICDTGVAEPAMADGVGASVTRLDGQAKVRGDRFGADDWPEGALTVVALRSPHPHARFRFGDLAGFARRPGVAAIFTAADIPGRNAFGVIPAFADQPAIAQSPARFRGECVALVAFEAGTEPDLTGFPIDWDPLPPLTTPAEAEAPGAALVHPDRAANQLIEGRVIRGDAASALLYRTRLYRTRGWRGMDGRRHAGYPRLHAGPGDGP